jgi:hypothetical protein
VLGVHQRPVDDRAGRRREDRHRRGARRDRREVLEQALADRVDVDRVRGVVDGDPRRAHAVGVADLEQLVERLRLAGDDVRARPVVGGEEQPALPHADQLLDGRGRQRHRHHPAEARDLDERAAAQRGHARGVLERQRAADAGGGDLALRVADDDRRLDAIGAPQPGERHVDREQRGLHDVHALEQRRAGHTAQHVLQRPVGVRAQRLGALLDAPREDRRLGPQVERHPGPLRALAREHERDLAGVARDAGHDVVGGLAERDGLDARQQRGAVGGGDERAVLEPRAAVGQRPRDVDRRVERVRRDVRVQPRGLLAQRRRAVRRQHPRHREAVAGGVGAARRLGGALLEHDVRVGPADAERRDRGAARALPARPRRLLGEQRDRSRGPVDVR